MDNNKTSVNGNESFDDIIQKRVSLLKKCCITEIVCGAIAFIIGIVMIIMYTTSGALSSIGLWAGSLTLCHGIVTMVLCVKENRNKEKVLVSLVLTMGMLAIAVAMIWLTASTVSILMTYPISVIDTLIPMLAMTIVLLVLGVILLLAAIINIAAHLYLVDAINRSNPPPHQVALAAGQLPSTYYQTQAGYVNPAGPPQPAGVVYNHPNNPTQYPPQYPPLGYQQQQPPPAAVRPTEQAASVPTTSAQY